MGFTAHLLSVLKSFYIYRVRFQNDKISYLRYLGASIGEGCQIITEIRNFGKEPWLIKIGDCVTITAGVVFITHDASSRLFRDRIPSMNKFGNRYGTIRIYNNSFIGINTILLPGVTIGPDSIVGTGSVVTKPVPPSCVVAGNPAQVICSLDEYIERYCKKMVPLQATNRDELRTELIRKLWGEER